MEAEARREPLRNETTMTAARDEILSNIRRSLGVTGREAPRRAVVAERLAGHPNGVIPQRGQLDGAARVAMFKAQALGALATVAEVASASEAPAEIARYLREANLPATIRMGEDAQLAALPWGATALDVSRGASDGHDLNGVSHAAGGVAETGTLILTSGPDNPTTVNFLPDNHIVLVDARDIARDYEGAWTALRATFGAGHMPRVVNMITGPSRSGDIEQTLLLGAHGPRNLHVVIVGEA